MEMFLYGSSYWCEHCNRNHAVSVWAVEEKEHTFYEVYDMDGDLVQRSGNIKVIEGLYPEDAPEGDDLPAMPTYEHQKWFAVVSKDLEILEVAPLEWAANGLWMKVSEAPEEVRIVLSLPLNPLQGNRVDDKIKSLADMEAGLHFISGGFVGGGYKVGENNQIYFMVNMPVDKE